MRNVLAVLLAGGAGERLHPLTKNRAKPAVPFGGIYRIIDFTLSNCLNSKCFRIVVLVQYKSLSLARHIRMGWNIFHPELGEFIDVIPPQQRVSSNWYLGTADAIYQNLYSIERELPEQVLILSGDHIYKMDYQKMVSFHRKVGAELTIAAIQTPVSEASRFGIVEVDSESRVVGFEEKPEEPKPLDDRPDMALASMGVYVFDTALLKATVTEDAELNTSHDFGKDILSKLVEKNRVYAYNFQDENKKNALYWRDVGTLDSYWSANMDLVAVDPVFNLYDKAWPLHTYLNVAPPAKFVFAQEGRRFGVAVDSIVSPGCIISGGIVKRSVLSPGVRINSYSHVEESILMDGASIGRHAHVRRTIIEKRVHIPEHAVIGYDLQEDAKRYRVTPEGIVVIA
ncbi:MAG TPA: glucose-1-phosphate adenylyltransferase [Candidatus Hydrogenedentes bacterium]|nr:glucose-1-phosphate adenylyltransferase [Candidatus Hydrogenedentota bacterium]HPG69523.1 glucose-1-phosphate adenylyltransferase [Candidatus Hydrogenedentota bacterium]